MISAWNRNRRVVQPTRIRTFSPQHKPTGFSRWLFRANALLGDADTCRAAGMDDYLAKPYSREQLGLVMARWLPVQLLEQTLDADSTVGSLFGPLEMPVRA